MKAFFCLITAPALFLQCAGRYEQPEVEARKAEIIRDGKYLFRDLNRNGEVDPYEDWRLPVAERIGNLVSLMTLEEKAGLMCHPNIAVPPDGKVVYDLTPDEIRAIEEGYSGPGSARGQMKSTATAKSYIEEKHFRCILNNGVAEPSAFARWSNAMQEIAEGTRLGIPILFSSDPRHGATLGGHLRGDQYFSPWPGIEGQYGLSATRDTALARRYGEVTAEEYRAVGLHMILGPQIDVTTEPRWGRNAGSFSESAELTAEMLEAFMDGAQGKAAGPSKILVMLKHWPGSGPHKGGTGDWLVYPGGNFDYHMIPWQSGIAKGALSVMTYYSGTYFDTLGVSYSKYMCTGILRERLGFRGAICTDWLVISSKGALRNDLIGIPLKDRYELSINAGVDQFGAETTPERIVELVREGRISEDRIDRSAARILEWMFVLGLFEDPYVDPEAAATVVGSEKNRQDGYRAMLESVVLLSDNKKILPFIPQNGKPDLYVSGIDSVTAASYGNLVANPSQADLAILQVSATGRNTPGEIRGAGAEVSIEFPRQTMDMIRRVAEAGTPLAVIVNVGGSLAVLPEELFRTAGATLMAFDVSGAALLDVIFGKHNPSGRLPFELPSSMEAVRSQLEDVPFDSKDPLFPYGFGLSYD